MKEEKEQPYGNHQQVRSKQPPCTVTLSVPALQAVKSVLAPAVHVGRAVLLQAAMTAATQHIQQMNTGSNCDGQSSHDTCCASGSSWAARRPALGHLVSPQHVLQPSHNIPERWPLLRCGGPALLNEVSPPLGWLWTGGITVIFVSTWQ
jgi:hypothetical protein